MLIVITTDIVPFMMILVIVLLSSTLYFMISLPSSEKFGYNAEVGGALWPFVSVFQTILGSFDISDYPTGSSLTMFIVLVIFAVVIMYATSRRQT